MKVNIADAFVSLILVCIFTPTMGLGGYVLSMYACEILNLGMSAYKLWDRLGSTAEKEKIPGSLQNQGI
jgi:O-antigen/teichoic acid export membrane protein